MLEFVNIDKFLEKAINLNLKQIRKIIIKTDVKNFVF
jgi:hypothetical protein